MTTEKTTGSQHRPTSRGTAVLLRSGAVAAVVVLLLVAPAALVSGSPGAAGVLTGGAVALLVFVGGSLVVDTVASIAPGLSLVFALTTYATQVLALGLFFSALSHSDLLGETLHARWLGATIIVVTVVWLVVQLVLSTRVRIPVYDLPAATDPGAGTGAGATAGAPSRAGER